MSTYQAFTVFGAEPGYGHTDVTCAGTLVGTVGYAANEHIELAANTIDDAYGEHEPESDSEALEVAERILKRIMGNNSTWRLGEPPGGLRYK